MCRSRQTLGLSPGSLQSSVPMPKTDSIVTQSGKILFINFDNLLMNAGGVRGKVRFSWPIRDLLPRLGPWDGSHAAAAVRRGVS